MKIIGEILDGMGPKWLIAKDSKGNEFEVLNPKHMKVYTDKNGQQWVKRPKPRPIGSNPVEDEKGKLKW